MGHSTNLFSKRKIFGKNKFDIQQQIFEKVFREPSDEIKIDRYYNEISKIELFKFLSHAGVKYIRN